MSTTAASRSSEPRLIATHTVAYNRWTLFVYDGALKLPFFLVHDEAHERQGFTRVRAQVDVRTLTDFGLAHVCVYAGPYAQRPQHARVIEVPIELSSGRVCFSVPEEPVESGSVVFGAGSYRLVVAQEELTNDCCNERIDVYLEQLEAPAGRSRILRADEHLDPPAPLVETARIDGTLPPPGLDLDEIFELSGTTEAQLVQMSRGKYVAMTRDEFVRMRQRAP